MKYCILNTHYGTFSIGSNIEECLFKYLTISINAKSHIATYQLKHYIQESQKYSDEWTIDEIRKDVYKTVVKKIQNRQYPNYKIYKEY